jgi:hypothetical protein
MYTAEETALNQANYVQESLKLHSVRPGLYILMRKAVILKYMPYILKVFSRIIRGQFNK